VFSLIVLSQLHDLKREENRLAGLIDAQRQSASSARAAASDDSCGAKIYSCASGCVTAVVEAVGCVRTLIGVVLLLLSLVLIGSLGATAADRYLNSTCKTACGYAVTTPSYFNPINALLVASSSVRILMIPWSFVSSRHLIRTFRFSRSII
jgi:hypothetical protein